MTNIFRYDLLCIEGIARGLRVFLGLDKPPAYKLVYPKGGESALLTTTVAPEVCYINKSSAFNPLIL